MVDTGGVHDPDETEDVRGRIEAFERGADGATGGAATGHEDTTIGQGNSGGTGTSFQQAPCHGCPLVGFWIVEFGGVGDCVTGCDATRACDATRGEDAAIGQGDGKAVPRGYQHGRSCGERTAEAEGFRRKFRQGAAGAPHYHDPTGWQQDGRGPCPGVPHGTNPRPRTSRGQLRGNLREKQGGENRSAGHTRHNETLSQFGETHRDHHLSENKNNELLRGTQLQT